MEPVQLREWQSDYRVRGLELSPSDRRLCEGLSSGEGRLRVTELADSVRFDASAWVGVVRLSQVEIRIVPKLVGENLGVLRMLEYSSGLGALARLESERTLAAARDGSLVDLLGILLAEASIEIAKDGVLSDYVTHYEALARLRGRLLPLEQVRRRFGQIQVLECQFDELETDIVENQLLAAALAVAKRTTADPEVRRLSARAHDVFSEVADAGVVSADTPSLEYNRRNERYRSAHVIARMFLRSLAVNDLYSPGAGESFAFLLDMNALFEDFVTRLLVDAFRFTDVRVRPQARDRTLIRDGRTGKPYAAVIPDILLERSGPPRRRVPVDAKYKLYDERKVDQADIYQTFFYAWAYHERDAVGAAPAFILYPGDARASGQHLIARTSYEETGASIRAIPIDVPSMLDAVRVGQVAPIKELTAALGMELPA